MTLASCPHCATRVPDDGAFCDACGRPLAACPAITPNFAVLKGLRIAPGGEEKSFEGRCAGRLLHVPRGGAGFGYDPLFVPDGYHESFSELGDAVKNVISQRARAWARLAEWVRGR